jgi:DNA helicase-2/ATP-dependent DNA helicase PcrA
MISYLRYIYNPRDTVALKRIINVPKRSIGADTVTKIEEYGQKK